jgi:hypothetical protein
MLAPAEEKAGGRSAIRCLLDREIETLAQTDPYRELVGWLRCFRAVARELVGFIWAAMTQAA